MIWYVESGKQKYSKIKPPKCHFICHKSNTDWRGVVPGTQLWDGFDSSFFQHFHRERSCRVRNAYRNAVKNARLCIRVSRTSVIIGLILNVTGNTVLIYAWQNLFNVATCLSCVLFIIRCSSVHIMRPLPIPTAQKVIKFSVIVSTRLSLSVPYLLRIEC